MVDSKFGRLLVLTRVANDRNRNIVYSCKCECGNIKNVTKTNLVKGVTKSCGCLRKELARRPKDILTRKKISNFAKIRCFSSETRKKMSLAQKGEKSHMWKGGISGESKMIRESSAYREWRNLVFKRDNWTCVLCGKGGNINADHIKPFIFFPELRFDTSNGRTLCVPCHKKTDTYGRKVHKFYPVESILREKFGYQKRT